MADMPLSSSIVTFEALKAISGYHQTSAVERWASSQGIRVFWGRNGPWTTIELINAAAGLAPGRGGDSYYSPDILK